MDGPAPTNSLKKTGGSHDCVPDNIQQIRPENMTDSEDWSRQSSPTLSQDELCETRFTQDTPLEKFAPSQRQRGGSDDDDNPKARKRFLIKVTVIVIFQLAITVSSVAPFVFDGIIRYNMRGYPPQPLALNWIFLAVALSTLIAITFLPRARSKIPYNFILLVVFTIAMGIVIGVSTSFRDSNTILIALGVALIVCTVVCLIGFVIPFDFTAKYGTIAVLVLQIGAVVLVFMYVIAYWVDVVGLQIAVGVFLTTALCVFLFYDTQRAVGWGERTLEVHDVVMGALTLYSDMVPILVVVHLVVCSCKELLDKI